MIASRDCTIYDFPQFSWWPFWKSSKRWVDPKLSSVNILILNQEGPLNKMIPLVEVAEGGVHGDPLLAHGLFRSIFEILSFIAIQQWYTFFFIPLLAWPSGQNAEKWTMQCMWDTHYTLLIYCYLSKQCIMSNKHIYEPQHDKTNKMSVRPAKTQISLGIRMKKAWVLSYPLSANEDWSDWADALLSDQSLFWAHTHFVGFVMSWLIYVLKWNIKKFDSIFTAIIQFLSYSTTDWPFAKLLMICQYFFQIHWWLLKLILNLLNKYEMKFQMFIVTFLKPSCGDRFTKGQTRGLSHHFCKPIPSRF